MYSEITFNALFCFLIRVAALKLLYETFFFNSLKIKVWRKIASSVRSFCAWINCRYCLVMEWVNFYLSVMWFRLCFNLRINFWKAVSLMHIFKVSVSFWTELLTVFKSSSSVSYQKVVCSFSRRKEPWKLPNILVFNWLPIN